MRSSLATSKLDVVVGMIDAELASRDPANQPVFRGAAAEFQSCDDFEAILAGPAETGKTFAMLWHLYTLLSQTSDASAVLVRKVRADMDATVLNTWRKVLAMRGGGVTCFGGEHPAFYDFPNGARLWIIGLDNPGKVLSGEHDYIAVNQAEELALLDWQTLSTRCTGRAGHTTKPRLVGDCNPSVPSHWILQRDGLRLLQSRHEDNPSLVNADGTLTPQGERTRSVLSKLTGVTGERLGWGKGKWVAAEGLVYSTYSQSVHLIDKFDIPPEWRRVRSIDFGYRNPFVCQWWAIDGDGRAYRYREIYHTERTVSRHAADINRLSVGEHIEATVCDHDAEDRATLEENGIPTVPAFKDIEFGIGKVNDRLAIQPDGKPRLFFMRGALVEEDESLRDAYKPTCTEQEIAAYSYPKGPDGKPTKEEPVKVDDHGVDDTRYLVCYLDHEATPWLLSMAKSGSLAQSRSAAPKAASPATYAELADRRANRGRR